MQEFSQNKLQDRRICYNLIDCGGVINDADADESVFMKMIEIKTALLCLVLSKF